MKKRTAQRLVAVLIPAHNEEVVLSRTIESVLKIVPKQDIYIVNDGSSDETLKIAKRFTKNVLTLQSGQGKADALNAGIAHFKLSSKYQFIFPVDADTRINPDFLEKALKHFRLDTKKEVVCVIGKVIGESTNWLTTYRMWEYEVSQLVHKSAQEKEKAIIVCPGCATVYRASLFSKIQFPTDTVVEDMDLTFLIHRAKLGKIAFVPGAKVTTQDPYRFSDYLKQIRRWYKGYWQCLRKYAIPWGGQRLDFELLLLTIEGLSAGLMVVLILAALPYILLKNPSFLLMPLVLDFVLFFFPTVFITMFIHSDLKFLKYMPTFYLLRIVNSLVFIYSFFESLLAFDGVEWTQITRYELKRGKICIAQ